MAEPNPRTTKLLIDRMVRRFQSVQPSRTSLLRGMHRLGMLLELQVKQSIVSKGLVDYGRLLNSIRYDVRETETGAEVVVGSYGVIYARIHEFGGVIRPVRARKLTIPANAWAKDHRARDFPNLFRVGNVLVDADKLGPNRGKTIPRGAIAFFLADSATIREKRYFRDGIDAATPRVLQIIREMRQQ